VELNVFEYVQGKTNGDLAQLLVDNYRFTALDNPLSLRPPMPNESTIERFTLPAAKSSIPSEASMILSVSTMLTGETIRTPSDGGPLSFLVPPSALSQSMAMLSTTTHLSDKTGDLQSDILPRSMDRSSFS
jgi:hypothetical protein